MSDPRESTIRELEKRLAESEGRLAASRRAKERAATVAALIAGGVDVRLAGPGAALMAEKEMIGTDADGAVVAVQTTPQGEEHVPLDSGIAAFLRTSAGKALLVASSAPTGGPRTRLTMTPALAAEVLGARPRPTVVPEGPRLTMTVAEAAKIFGELSRGR
jgi:hypothetical protein